MENKVQAVMGAAIHGMIKKIRDEVPEKGKFAQKAVTFEPQYFGGEFEKAYVTDMGIGIEPDGRQEDIRWLFAAVQLPNSNYVRMAYLLKGTNQEIIAYLNRPECGKEIKEIFLRLDTNARMKD